MHPFESVAAMFHGDRQYASLPASSNRVRQDYPFRRVVSEVKDQPGAWNRILPASASEHLQGRQVAIEEAILVQQHHRIAGRVIQGTQFGLGFEQCIFCLLAFGDVRIGTGHAHRATVAIALHHFTVGMHPCPFSIVAFDAKLNRIELGISLEYPFQIGADQCSVFRMYLAMNCSLETSISCFAPPIINDQRSLRYTRSLRNIPIPQCQIGTIQRKIESLLRQAG